MNKLEYISAYRHFCRNGEKIRISCFTLSSDFNSYIIECNGNNNLMEFSSVLHCTDRKIAFRRFVDIVDFNLS